MSDQEIVSGVVPALPEVLAVFDEVDLMGYPFLKLQRECAEPTLFEQDHVQIEITSPDGKPLATVWDGDLLIFLCSKLQEEIRRGREPGRWVAFKVNEFLRFTQRAKGGSGYRQTIDAIRRLSKTHVVTNIRMQSKPGKERGFSLISDYRLETEETESGMAEVEVCNWLHSSIMSGRVLQLDRGYFRIGNPTAKAVYRVIRSRDAKGETEIGLGELQRLIGSTVEPRRFKFNMRQLVRDQYGADGKKRFPGYVLDMAQDGARRVDLLTWTEEKSYAEVI